MSSQKKRVRDSSSVNTVLVEIYEDLAHEDEEIRIKAAHRLLTQHFGTANETEVRTAIKRLIRGLCSSRKSARLGFSTALVECLAALDGHDSSIPASEVVDILESTTVPESGTSGQDERDHYFGRLFGSDAIIKSGILFKDSELSQWQRLLDVICGVAEKKPWLRRECGYILLTAIVGSTADEKSQTPFLVILNKLHQHKLIRTPEGLAIWIAIQQKIPRAKLPKTLWKHDDPLAKQDLNSLAQILRDSKASWKDDEDFEAQGSAMWTSKLHFAWDIVLSELFKEQKNKNQVNFKDFWKVAVDDGLMSLQSSKERKYWGLLLLQKVIQSAPLECLQESFTTNVVSCMMQSLKLRDRYLQKGVQNALRSLQNRAETQPSDVAPIATILLQIVNFGDFDIVTKTKTVETVCASVNPRVQADLAKLFFRLFKSPQTAVDAEVSARRKTLINIQARNISTLVNVDIDDSGSGKIDGLEHTLQGWTNLLKGSQKPQQEDAPLSDATKTQLREALTVGFGQAFKIGEPGRAVVLHCVALLRKFQLAADPEILDTVNTGWQRFDHHRQSGRHNSDTTEKSHKKAKKGSKETPASVRSETSTSANEGLALLYGLVIFQIYIEETEAVSILEELIAFEEQASLDRSTDAKHQSFGNADGLVEILLSFASRQSKFLRRITLEIFEAFTAQITAGGLASFTDILATKESKAGQSELFEADDADAAELDDDDGSDGSGASDVEMLDSDVEVISAEAESPKSGSGWDSSGETSSSDTDDVNESEEGEETLNDDEADLIALEQAIANTLKTRKLKPSDMLESDSGSEAESSSDSDMTDSEMLALDNKLADVFRARAANQSTSQQKKKDNKSAKEKMTHFKNRVLELIEVYLRKEYLNPTALVLIGPLLRLSRETLVPQLRTRAVGLVRELCGKCKGLGNVPVLHHAAEVAVHGKKRKRETEVPEEAGSQVDVEAALAIFHDIHEEVCQGQVNAHKTACNQASILLAKTLFKAGVQPDVCVGVYAATQLRALTDAECTVQPHFFTEWAIFCGTVKGKLGVAVDDINGIGHTDGEASGTAGQSKEEENETKIRKKNNKNKNKSKSSKKKQKSDKASS